MDPLDPLDPETLDVLRREGLVPARLRLRDASAAPYTSAGLPSLRTYDVPELAGANLQGFMVNRTRSSSTDPRTLSQAVFAAPEAKRDVQAHEQEHLLARQNLGPASNINTKFDELINNKNARQQFVQAAVNLAPYLKEKYGIDNAYFSPQMLRQGGAALDEQLASLAGFEAANNIDLTKDPVLRKSLFKDKDVRETYNAITGLRQTRLDARDLPPYTRQPELDTSAVGKLKNLLKFAEGGYVPNAGGRKSF